jgi:hypothetical protein
VALYTRNGSRVTPKIAGDGVDGEDDVAGLDDEKHREHRSGVPATSYGRTGGALVVGEFAIADEQVCADDMAGRREVAAHHPDDRVALPVTGRVPLAPEHPHAAEHEQDAEDVDDPVEEREQLRARRDERASQDEGAEDAVEQHAVLVAGRDPEGAEDERPHEHVVQRQRLLERVAREELLGDRSPFEDPEHRPEPDADRDEPGGRPGGVAHGHLVSAPVDHEKVECQERDEAGSEADPGKERDVHRAALGLIPESSALAVHRLVANLARRVVGIGDGDQVPHW